MKKRINWQFAAILKGLFIKHNITQRRLALACELDETHISRVMRGKRMMSSDILYKISQILGMSEIKLKQIQMDVENVNFYFRTQFISKTIREN